MATENIVNEEKGVLSRGPTLKYTSDLHSNILLAC